MSNDNLKIGQRIRLSRVHEGGVVKIRGKRAIVTDRYPSDRVSGGTKLAYSDGGRATHIWDEDDPEVIYRRQGRLVIKIILETGF